MAKFLDTPGVSFQLSEIIKNARERLVIISPFLRVNDRIKELLEDKDRMRIDVWVIYGKNELRPEENNWLRSMTSIKTGFLQNLHAKCYMNENEALLTSMNLYEFSQINNNEMGIIVSRDQDTELYEEIKEESMRLVRASEIIRVTVDKIEATETETKAATTRARREPQQAAAKTDCPEHNTPWREGNQGGFYHAGGCTPSKLLRGVAEEIKLDHQQLNDRLKREFGVTASKLTPEQIAQVYAELTREPTRRS